MMVSLVSRSFEHQFEGLDVAKLPRLTPRMKLSGHFNERSVGHVRFVSEFVLVCGQVCASAHQLIFVWCQKAKNHFTRTLAIVSHFAIQPFNRGREDILKVLFLGAKLAAHFFNAWEIIMLDPNDRDPPLVGRFRNRRRQCNADFNLVLER